MRSRDGAARAQKKSAASRLSFPQTLLPAIPGDALEIDELVVRSRFKRRYKYLWLVVSRITHQVLAWKVGDRSEKTLQELWWQVPPAYRRKLVYSDFYKAYTAWLTPRGSPPGSIAPAKKAAAKPASSKA